MQHAPEDMERRPRAATKKHGLNRCRAANTTKAKKKLRLRKVELTNLRKATWWWYRRRNRLALAPDAVCPATPATALPGATPAASVRLRFAAPTATSPSPPPPRAPLLARQSALLLGFVVALAADSRFEAAPTTAPVLPGSSPPSSRFRVTVMPRQKVAEERADAAPLQRTRASLCA